MLGLAPDHGRGNTHADAPASPVRAERQNPAARCAPLVALAVGGFLLPWCAVLALTLPATTTAQHWSLAWAGLDFAEAVMALVTAVLLTIRSPRASLAAAVGATLLLLDAWFDVCTSAPGLDHTLAVAEAIFAEVPLAGAAIWLAIALTRTNR